MKRFTILLGLAVLFLTPVVRADVPKLINFQGILRDGSGNPVADGAYTVRFRIYDDSTTAEANFLWTETVPVQTTGGLFNVRLGDDTPLPNTLFTGSNRFVGVKVNVDAEMPRVRLISVPYALHSLRSDSAVTATVALDLTCTGCVVGGLSGTILDGSITIEDLGTNSVAADEIAAGAVGTSEIDATQVQRRVTGTAPPNEYITAINQDGSVVTALDQVGAAGWNLIGNGGTTPGTNFLGTTDNVALELKVNNSRALRIEPMTASPNWIGGRSNNSVTSGVAGAFIGGGGASGFNNRVTDDHGTVGGGANNQAGNNTGTLTDGYRATVGGGFGNVASGQNSTVGGGLNDTASNTAATVGGGQANVASNYAATVSGGAGNRATGGNAPTVGGGSQNTAGTRGATVGGGEQNYALFLATVGGGQRDSATGAYSTIPGGLSNETSEWYAFAAGRQAKARHRGSFVWADSTNADFASTADNQFLIRAANVGIGLNNPSKKLEVAGSIKVGTDDTVFSSNISSNSPLSLQAPAGSTRMYIDDATGNVGIGTTSPTTRLEVAGGQLSVDAGTDAAPGYSFAGDLNTGIYGFSDFLFFSTGGAQRGYFTTNGFVVPGRAQIGTTTAFGDPSTLYVQGSISTAITTVVGATTLTASNSVVLVNTGATTITLPLAALAPGRQYTIKKISATAGIVTVDGAGAETIDGAATHSITLQYEYVTIVSNGSGWFVVADN